MYIKLLFCVSLKGQRKLYQYKNDVTLIQLVKAKGRTSEMCCSPGGGGRGKKKISILQEKIEQKKLKAKKNFQAKVNKNYKRKTQTKFQRSPKTFHLGFWILKYSTSIPGVFAAEYSRWEKEKPWERVTKLSSAGRLQWNKFQYISWVPAESPETRRCRCEKIKYF